MKKPEIYWVSWVDANAEAGWGDPKHLDLSHCESVGFLVKETEEYLSLAAAIGLNETSLESNAVITIPLAWITEAKKVEL